MDHLPENIQRVISRFDPISLDEMDSVKLLNRTDTKFTLPLDQLPMILEEIKDSYKVLEIGEMRYTRYKTLYFDTEDHRLYLNHHNGKLNRFKVRLRQYRDSGLNYFEIKHKTNKKRTVKSRVKRSEFVESIEGKSNDLIRKVMEIDGNELHPALWVYFNRITLVSLKMDERLTLDTGLQFRFDGREAAFEGIAIAEVKQDRFLKSAFMETMIRHKIHRVSLSKYCLGMATLFDGIKKNNFKVRLKQINQMNHAAL